MPLAIAVMLRCETFLAPMVAVLPIAFGLAHGTACGTPVRNAAA
jgi:hypothetical protein